MKFSAATGWLFGLAYGSCVAEAAPQGWKAIAFCGSLAGVSLLLDIAKGAAK